MILLKESLVKTLKMAVSVPDSLPRDLRSEPSTNLIRDVYLDGFDAYVVGK